MKIDELKQVVNDLIKEQIEAVRASGQALDGDVQTGVTKTDLADILKELNIGHTVAAGGMIVTESGSWINPNSDRPWVKLSPEMESFVMGVKELINTGQTKLLQENNDPTGGYTVPEEFSATMVQYDTEPAIVWPRATIWPMNTDKLGMPKVGQRPDADAADFDHFAGVVFTWTEEGASKHETEPTFEFIELIAHELSGYTEVTNILLEDSAINILNFLTGLFRRAWIWYTDRSFLRGNGARQPVGICQNDPAVLVVPRAVAGTVSYTDIVNMENKLPSVFETGAVWMCNKRVLNALRNERSALTGELILQQFYHTGPGGVGTKMVEMLLGYPVVRADQKTMPIGIRGDVVFGNWTWYYIGNRRGFTMDSSKHFRFRSNRLALRVTGRLDGQAAIPEAFCVLGDVTEGS